jgi:hypothetical protein
MLQYVDSKGRQERSFDGTVLNLAQGLVHLQTSTLEYCTPGHRMGRSYHLLITALAGAISLSAD